MNATIIENILRALVTALPDDYFKQELDRRNIAAPKAELNAKEMLEALSDRGVHDSDLWNIVDDKTAIVLDNLDCVSSKELIKELASRGDFDPQILRKVSDEDLWSSIKDKEQMLLDHLSDLADDDLWYAIDDKEQVIRENLGEVDDADILDNLSDAEYSISQWIRGADESVVKFLLGQLRDDVLLSAFPDKKALAQQAVVNLHGDEMLDVLDCCGETTTRAMLANHLERQGELRFFLVSQASTDLYEALKEKGDSPKLSAEDIIASAHACRFDVGTTLNIIRALLDTL